jgi:hypothetical protein
MNNISFNPNINSVHFASKTTKPKTENILSKETTMDSFESQTQKSGSNLSTEEKQKLIRSAKAKAAGWSVFTEEFSTLYYGLRSNKTIAKKYDLDTKEDKSLIKQIRKEQIKSTIPGVLFPGVGGIISYVYNKNADPSKIKIKEKIKE